METAAPLTAADLQAFVAHIDRGLDTLRTEMREGFARVETRFTQIDTRFDHIDRRFDQIDSRFDQIEARFARLEQRIMPLWASWYITLLLTIIAAAVVYGVLR